MSYNMVTQKKIEPDFEMVENVLRKLNGVFDTYDLYRHSNNGEMFEFHFKKKDVRCEAWQITFLGKVVISGGDSFYCNEMDYDDFYEEGYLYLIEQNAELIYQKAYENAIHYIHTLLQYASLFEIDNSCKKEWIEKINSGIEKMDTDKLDKDRTWWSSFSLSDKKEQEESQCL